MDSFFFAMEMECVASFFPFIIAQVVLIKTISVERREEERWKVAPDHIYLGSGDSKSTWAALVLLFYYYYYYYYCSARGMPSDGVASAAGCGDVLDHCVLGLDVNNGRGSGARETSGS